jgi:hypothetical protein
MDESLARESHRNDDTTKRDNEGTQHKHHEAKTVDHRIFPCCRACGVDFQMTSVQTSANGEVTASSTIPRRIGIVYQQEVADVSGWQTGNVQSMERDGNKIEDKYVDKYVGSNGV